MLLGIDQISSLRRQWRGKRVGLLCHAASLDSKGRHILDLPEFRIEGSKSRVPKKTPSLLLARLFGPEHGIWGVAQDMETVDSGVDPHTGLLVYSLYGSDGESLKPSPAWLESLEVVICDLQDVGSRYYTFIYTIAFLMKACAQLKIPVFVLDRPNPLNGLTIEGGQIRPGYESFVGAYSIPNRHGMTVGELALYFNESHAQKADLKIISLKGWKRKLYFDEIKLPWVLPSPNMPTLDTALVYPGMCLLEATEISEGRGTTRPFEIFGAPFVDPYALARYLKEFKLRGLFFRPLYFRPTFQKQAGKICGGLQLHVQDRKRFKPYLTGLAILKALYDLYPTQFRWREKPYEFIDQIPAIDLLTGSDKFRKQLEAGASWREIKAGYETGKEQFIKQTRSFLLY